MTNFMEQGARSRDTGSPVGPEKGRGTNSPLKASRGTTLPTPWLLSHVTDSDPLTPELDESTCVLL